jgi:hypothetical protein
MIAFHGWRWTVLDSGLRLATIAPVTTSPPRSRIELDLFLLLEWAYECPVCSCEHRKAYHDVPPAESTGAR